jgi:hypothetical protein
MSVAEGWLESIQEIDTMLLVWQSLKVGLDF